jgi:hypothetical protein
MTSPSPVPSTVPSSVASGAVMRIGREPTMTREHVAAELVGPEQMRRRRRLVDAQEVLGQRVLHDQAAEDRRQDPEAQDEGPDDERLAMDELAQEVSAQVGAGDADRGRRFDRDGADAHSTPRYRMRGLSSVKRMSAASVATM